jgi:hypothetical protein
MDIQQFIQYKIPIFLFSVFLYSLFLTIHEVSTRDKSCNILQSNPIQQNYKMLFGTKLKKIFMIFIILFMYFSVFYGVSKSTSWNESTQLYFLIYGFIILFVANWMFITGIHKGIKDIGNSTIMNVFSSLIYMGFYAILILYFILNLANDGPLLGIENIFILTIVSIIGIMGYREAMRIKEIMMTDLKKNSYNFMTVQCFPTGDFQEDYQNPDNENPSLLQYRNLITEKGTDYIKLQENIPIQFKNPITQKYQDLILADFYFPGSYYTYIEDTPINGHPSLESIQLAFEDYKVRIVHLDIYGSKKDKNQPCVRCAKMAKDAKELSLESCFRVIEKYGWNEKQKYPIFLYLRFMEENTEEFYNRVMKTYMKIFSSHLMNKKYSFSGRNGTFPISKAPMKDCIQKIILLTNVYPTRTAFDEMIQAGNVFEKDKNLFMNIELYKESYVNFNSIGIAQDQDKTKLYKSHQRNMSFFYTEPNETKYVPEQNKSGLYNSNFQDVAQYGIQGTMMYLFVPDNNLNNWFMFFQRKNSMYPVIKDETLIALEPEKEPLEQQKPILGLQNPQKYCIIPGFLETEKSNITTGDANNTCSTSF